MATQPYFELDTTGKSKAHRKENEVYTLPNPGKYARAISLTMGCFFTESVIITDGVTSVELKKGIDYIVTEVYSSLSIIYGKEIAATLVITNPSVSSTVKVSYNFLGTRFANNIQSLAASINREADSRDISSLQWDLMNKAKTFIPSDYARQIGSGVGFEAIVFGLERIRSTILYGDFDIDMTIGQFVDKFIVAIDRALSDKVSIEYKDELTAFKNQFTKEMLGLDKVVNMGIAPTEVVRYGVVRDYQFDRNNDGYVAIKALCRFKEELYNNLVSSEQTGIGKYYGVYGLPLLSVLYSLRNGAGVIIQSLQTSLASGITFNRVLYPDQTAIEDRWSIVKLTNNLNGQGGVLWGSNMTTSELYVGYLKNDSNDSDVLTWTKIYGEFDLEKALKALHEHINDIENPHRVNKHMLLLGNVENLPTADAEDLACRVPSDKMVTHKFLLAFMDTYMDGLPTAEDVAKMNCDENDLAKHIKLIFAPCGPCGPCCEPNVIRVTTTTSRPPIVDPEGQLTGWFCENHKRWDVITDGKGGTRTVEHFYGPEDEDKIKDGCVFQTTTTTPVPILEFKVTPASLVMSEGDSNIFTIEAPLAPEGTIVYWSLFGTDITAADFQDSIAGTVLIRDGRATVTVRPGVQDVSEGVEWFQMRLRTGNANGTTVATSAEVRLNNAAPVFGGGTPVFGGT